MPRLPHIQQKNILQLQNQVLEGNKQKIHIHWLSLIFLWPSAHFKTLTYDKCHIHTLTWHTPQYNYASLELFTSATCRVFLKLTSWFCSLDFKALKTHRPKTQTLFAKNERCQKIWGKNLMRFFCHHHSMII